MINKIVQIDLGCRSRQHIENQRHYFAKGPSSQSCVFPVIVYGCENWTIKKAKGWRIDAFKLWCQRRLLRVPWPTRRSNQSILKEICPEYSLEGLMLKLKLQYFGHLIQKSWLSWKDPDAGKDRRQEEKGTTGWDGWMASLTLWTWVWASFGSWWWTKRPGVLQSMGSQRVRHDWGIQHSTAHITCCQSHSHVWLCDPMDYSLPGSSVHGFSQARILQWVAISFSSDFLDPGIEPKTCASPALAGEFFTTEPPGKP